MEVIYKRSFKNDILQYFSFIINTWLLAKTSKSLLAMHKEILNFLSDHYLNERILKNCLHAHIFLVFTYLAFIKYSEIPFFYFGSEVFNETIALVLFYPFL